MTRIGHFVTTPDGFSGRLKTLTLDLELMLVPATEAQGEGVPDVRVMAGTGDEAIEVGAGWKRVGERAGAFIALVIDDPAFPAPLRANLFQAESGEHVLLWNRRTRRAGRA